MRNARRLLAALLAVVMLIPSILVPGYAAETTGFKDVREDSWYANAVDYVSAAGYMKGTSKDAFSPGEDVTRAMFVTILSRVARAQTDNTASAFGDVAANQYYSGAIEWAAEKEIVNGVGGGLFAPYRSITRQDLAVMLYRFVNAMGYELSEGESRTYTDEAAISAYAADAVRFVTSTGLFAGYQDGSFRPKATATRAQTAVIVMRLAQLLDGQIVEPVPMPAQEFNGAAGEDMTVAVNAPVGALPENTNMTVSRVTDEARLAAIAEKTGTEIYAAADITFSKDGAELEPEKNVEVQISLDGLESIKNPTVVHVKDDGSVEYVAAEVVSATRGSEKALRFYAKDFSVYAVTDILGDDVTVTVNFYVRKNGASGPSADAGDWEIINRQILRKTQIVSAETPFTDPGVPNLSTNQSFEGWFYDSGSFTESDTGESVAVINQRAKQYAAEGGDHLAQNETWDFYAMVYNVAYVVFHDQAGAVLRTTPYHVAEGTGYANAMINMTYAPFKDNQNFTGWVTKKDVLTTGDYPTYKDNPDPVIRNNTEYQVSETLELYPYLQDGYWLIFDPNIANNDSDPTKCEYKGPDFVPKGTLTSAPTFKNEHPRPGYDLEGWYTDPTLRNRYTFDQALTKDTTLYAKWTPIEASYTVVFRVQNATDPYDTDVSNNTYSFYDSVSRSWRNTTGTYVQTKSGDTVSAFSRGTSNDTTLASAGIAQNDYYPKAISALGQYYHYSTEKNANNSVTVRGDGSAVLYVYYDRMPVTLNFYYGTFSSSTSDTMYQSGGYYYYYYTFMQYFGVSGKSAIPLTLVYNSSNTTSDGNLIREDLASFKVTSTGASYTGDIYVFLQGTTDGDLIASITGLYGAEISDTDKAKFKVEDPYVYCFESGTNSDGDTTYTMMPDVTNYAPGNNYSGNAYTINYFCETKPVSTGEKTLHLISQNPDTGEWGEEYSSDTITNLVGLVVGNSTGRTFIGYNLRGDSMTNAYFVSLNGNTTYTFEYDNITGNNAYAYKRLNNYDLVFMSNGREVRRETLRYRQHTAAFAYKRIDETTLSTTELYIPDDGPEGYYFEGWYTDNTFQNKYKFTGRMPARNLTLYAKWTMTRYRVFLDYAGGDSEAQISFPDGTYSTTWGLDYGEQVDENRIANVTRDGWVLLGWYLDPEYKHAFNFSMGANDSMVYGDEAYYYGIQMPGESDEAYTARMNGSTRRGTDPVSGSAWDDTWDTDWESHDYSGEYETAGYETADDMRTARGERHNVVHTIRLYAKWRHDPEGTIGIRVNYLGDHSETDTGYFNTDGQPHIWKDPELYVDRADAYAQAASVPENANEHFLYWEILDKDGNPTGRVAYPGQTWQVRLEDAAEVRVPVPNPNCAHDGGATHVEAKEPTCTEKGNVEYWSCNLCGKYFSDATLSTVLDDPFIAANGHTWGEWQYQQNGQGGHYHICSVCQAKAGGAHVMEQTAYTAPTTTSVGSKTEECTVCGYTVTTTLPILQGYTVSFSVPAGVTKPADQTGLEDGTSITLPTEPAGTPSGYIFKGWVTGPVAETTAQPDDIKAGGGSYTVHGNTDFYALYTKGTDQVIYQLADHFTDGGKFIIVAQSSISGTTGYAVSNAIMTSSGHYLQRSAVTISDNTCTSSDAASVLWVAAGSDANGWTLYNEATQKYMGLDADEYLNLTDVGLAWKYTADKWLDNQTDSESYYYLSYKAANVTTPYYTTGKSGQNTYETNLYQEILPTYTTGTAVSGGNTVTEPEQPTRGIQVDQNPVTATSDKYEVVSAPVAGGKYLVVYEYASEDSYYHYVMSTDYYSTANSRQPKGVSVTLTKNSDSTYSLGTDCASYLLTAGDSGNSSYPWTFYNESKGYLCANSSGYLSFRSTEGDLACWKYTTDKYLVNNNSRFPYVYFSSSNYFDLYSSADSVIYLLKLVENTTPKYTLTIHYKYADGSQAHEDYVGQFEAGKPYSVTSPTITGFTPNEPLVSGTMPSGDHSRTVYYNPNTVSNERWAPTQDIVPGEDYLIAYVLGGKPYLLVNYNVSAENHYSNDVVSGTTTASLGYLAPATVVTENGTEYVSGVTGAATDLQYCHWIFSDADGGTITSGYESERSLYWNGLLSGAAGVSPYTSGDTWKWVRNSTGNMGAMRNTYTSNAGNTYIFYFYPRTANGAESTSTTAPYAGVSQTSFTNVRLYHKVVTSDTTWTVSFVDEDGVSMTDEGYAPYEVKEGNTVTRPADPERKDYYFLGWYYVNSEGQEVAYNFGQPVHSDLTLIAHFLYAWEVQYTITLRAVYGIPNTTGRTFIYWYANDGTDYGHGVGAGDRFEMLEMDQNVAYDIPTPNGAVPTGSSPTNMGWTGGSQYYHDDQGNPTVSFKQNDTTHQDTLGGPERVFLGWARVPVPTGESGTVGTYHPELTEDDLYLKWTGERYQYKNDQGVWTDLTSGDLAGQVYATDDATYHDMYAVWASYAYIFHSATGKMEAVEVKRGVNVDLVSKVPAGYLYGGYYTEYGGVKGIVSDADLNAAKAQATQNCYSADHAGGSAAAKLVAVNGAVTYNGESLMNANNARFWTKAKAYGYGAQADAPSGDKLTPTVGTVYYVKEVPAAFLPNRLVYVRAQKNTTLVDGTEVKAGKITSLYLLTALDDRYYADHGFFVGDANSGQDVTGLDENSGSADTLSRVFTIFIKNGETKSYNAHTLNPVIGANAEDPDLVGYVSAKHLDYKWIQGHVSNNADTPTFYLNPYWTTLDGVTVTQNNIKGVSITSDGTGIQTVNMP